MSQSKAFFDTNIVIYAFLKNDPRTPTAIDLLLADGQISVQILNEFVSVAQRKLKMPWPEILESYATLTVLFPAPVPLTAQLHQAAVQIAHRYGYHIYDALVIASALQANCEILYSEDMHHGQVIEGLRIQNPFSALPPQ